MNPSDTPVVAPSLRMQRATWIWRRVVLPLGVLVQLGMLLNILRRVPDGVLVLITLLVWARMTLEGQEKSPGGWPRVKEAPEGGT